MNLQMIEDVIVEPLKIFSDSRGKVLHMLRKDASFFKQFGEVYFSLVNPGVIKGWKKHLKITQHFAVPIGNIKLVLYDSRDDSSTKGKIQEIIIGVDNYKLVKIPPLICYSFKALFSKPALVANCTDLPYDPAESINIHLCDESIVYKWGNENDN